MRLKSSLLYINITLTIVLQNHSRVSGCTGLFSLKQTSSSELVPSQEFHLFFPWLASTMYHEAFIYFIGQVLALMEYQARLLETAPVWEECKRKCPPGRLRTQLDRYGCFACPDLFEGSRMRQSKGERGNRRNSSLRLGISVLLIRWVVIGGVKVCGRVTASL